MQAIAATGHWYKVVLPDNREGFIESKSVSGQPYKKQVTKNVMRLLDAPDTIAAVKTIIPAGSSINVLGDHGLYHFVYYNEQKGWIQPD